MKKQAYRRFIPNFFTLMSMFFGFYSMVLSSNGRFRDAAWLIIIAAIFDALDGLSARLLKSGSEFGVELDSLADVISFGAAPSLLIYHAVFEKFGIWGILFSSSLLLAGGFRLARFNSELTDYDKKSFSGLPIPSSAITLASFVFLSENAGLIREQFIIWAFPLVITLSLLMVSRIKYETLPKFSVEGVKDKPFHFLFLIAGLITTIFWGAGMIFYFFLLVILFGIFRETYYKLLTPHSKSELSER